VSIVLTSELFAVAKCLSAANETLSVHSTDMLTGVQANEEDTKSEGLVSDEDCCEQVTSDEDEDENEDAP
jgi:hypothetical protein